MSSHSMLPYSNSAATQKPTSTTTLPVGITVTGKELTLPTTRLEGQWEFHPDTKRGTQCLGLSCPIPCQFKRPGQPAATLQLFFANHKKLLYLCIALYGIPYGCRPQCNSTLKRNRHQGSAPNPGGEEGTTCKSWAVAQL